MLNCKIDGETCSSEQCRNTVFVEFVNAEIKCNMKMWGLYLCSMTSLGLNMKDMSLTQLQSNKRY